MNEPAEISIRDLVADVWGHKWRIGMVALFCGVLGVVAGKFITRYYEASVLLSPLPQDGTSGVGGALGGLAAQYGGLASLSGINLFGGSQKDEVVAVLQSQLLTERFIRDANLLPSLYADLWDEGAGAWKTSDKARIPTVWNANRYFATRIRSVSTDGRTGLVRLTIKWKDPEEAARWANGLVRLTNEYLREKAIAEARRNIDYLGEQALQAPTVEVRRTIYSVLENEINKEMIAKGRDEFALKTIDPAFVPERPSTPGSFHLGIFGALLGGFGYLAYLLTRRVMSAD